MDDVKDTRRLTVETVTTPTLESKSADTSTYTPFKAIMDRIQVKVLDEQVQGEDGVMVAPKYRQHSNKGIVVSVGDWVIIGGKMAPIDFIKPGDKVLFGEYNCEKFVEGDQEYELVRVQDIRGVERMIDTSAEEKAAAEKYWLGRSYGGNTSDPDTKVIASLEPEGIDEKKMEAMQKELAAQRNAADIMIKKLTQEANSDADDSQEITSRG